MLLWAIDGASTLTAVPFTTFASMTDAGWFAPRLSQRLQKQFRDEPFNKARLKIVLQSLQDEYRHARGNAQPPWVWPVAAARIVEVDRATEEGHMSIFPYADCFVEILQGSQPSADDIAMPKELLQTHDLWRPFSGFEGHQLVGLRQRRCQQQENEARTALTLNPVSAMNAIEE